MLTPPEKSAALAAIVEQPGVSLRAKLRQWLSRYGLAECAGITCALLGSFLVRRATGSAARNVSSFREAATARASLS